ncbi:MAG: iron-containing alcohol dehydrogenase [Verrucomicrobiota bacterium]
MNPADLLGKTFVCECGKKHSVPIREIIYSESAIKDAPAILGRNFCGKTTAIIADKRTCAAAGKVLNDSLAAQGWQVDNLIIPDSADGKEPICDDNTLDYLLNRLPKRNFYIAVGSGVISDLTKWAACKTGKPYAVLATAASMNGYSSANIAPTIKGVKRLVDGTCPLVIMAVPSIFNQAPYKLTTAGLGDVLAKPVSITDWRVSNLLFGEYFCPLCARLISEIEPAYLNNPGDIFLRKPAAMKALFNALIYSGLSMTIAGTSSPSSGGEHMISHALDSTALAHGLTHDYHGRQVGLGTIFACALYERILALENPRFQLQTEETNRTFWQSLVPVVEEEHAHKRSRAAKAVEQLKKKDCWNELRAIVRKSVRTPSKIRNCLKSAGAAYRLADIGCEHARFLDAALNCHQMRARYTVIDLARAVGIMPKAADEIIEEYLL